MNISTKLISISTWVVLEGSPSKGKRRVVAGTVSHQHDELAKHHPHLRCRTFKEILYKAVWLSKQHMLGKPGTGVD